MLIIYAETATYVDMLYSDTVLLQLVLQLIDPIAQCLKVTHIENLASDMEMQPNEADVLQPFGLGYNTQHISHGNSEFVLSQPCRDIRMSMSANIRVQTEGYTCRLTFLCSQIVDDFQLRDTLNVEAEDIVIQSKVNLPVALTYAGKDNLRCRKACLHGSINLSATHTVGTKSGLTDQAKQTRISVGFDSIVYDKALMLTGFFVDCAQSLAQQFSIVIVEGRLYRLQLL